ncbi:hypothetical protein [Steroidobacter cummioxidans]|uniref:hypothetical protein n=1 Tax=Steroidobacter cummioxidans TaxID=1803913 RepID=UPI00128FD4DF|nr:hypothetical protein [Steroidobacter cummioxidans]
MRTSQIRKTRLMAATFMLLATALAAGEVVGQATSESAERPAAQAQSPVRPLLYYFEHVSLRDAAFRYDRDIQALIANPRQAGEPVTRLFAKAAQHAVHVPNFKAETVADDMIRFMRQIGFETLRRGGYTIHLMRMPPPEHPPEAYFVAIVYKDGEPLIEGTPASSTRYITLERTAVEGRVFALCEWDVNGQHKTHGFANHEPTLRDLVANVSAMLGIDAN